MQNSLIKLPLCSWWHALYHACSPWVHEKSAKIFSKKITWLYNSTMWVWPSYHQWLIHTSISQPSGDIPNFTHLLNQLGIYQLFIHDWDIEITTSSFPNIVGVKFTSYDQKGLIKDYDKERHIITSWAFIWPLHRMIYMTFITKTKDLKKTMIVTISYHTTYMICTISIYLSLTSRPTTCICPSSVPKIWQGKYHQYVTKYITHRYQLILLISSRSTSSVTLVE